MLTVATLFHCVSPSSQSRQITAFYLDAGRRQPGHHLTQTAIRVAGYQPSRSQRRMANLHPSPFLNDAGRRAAHVHALRKLIFPSVADPTDAIPLKADRGEISSTLGKTRSGGGGFGCKPPPRKSKHQRQRDCNAIPRDSAGWQRKGCSHPG